MFQSADVKPRSIHIEINSSGDVHISPTKKNGKHSDALFGEPEKPRWKVPWAARTLVHFTGLNLFFSHYCPGLWSNSTTKMASI